MRKLLFSSSLLILLAACGTSEDSISTKDRVASSDTTQVNVSVDDSSKAIIHGSPEQEEIDSLKRIKQEENKK